PHVDARLDVGDVEVDSPGGGERGKCDREHACEAVTARHGAYAGRRSPKSPTPASSTNAGASEITYSGTASTMKAVVTSTNNAARAMATGAATRRGLRTASATTATRSHTIGRGNQRDAWS